jgi:hypothetical protein
MSLFVGLTAMTKYVIVVAVLLLTAQAYGNGDPGFLIENPTHWFVVQLLVASVRVPSADVDDAVPESKRNGGWPSTNVPLPSVSLASQIQVPSAIPNGDPLAYVSL